MVENRKGGVGKTIVSANLSATAASMDYKTLHIDMDPQGDSSQCFELHQAIRGLKGEVNGEPGPDAKRDIGMVLRSTLTEDENGNPISPKPVSLKDVMYKYTLKEWVDKSQKNKPGVVEFEDFDFKTGEPYYRYFIPRVIENLDIIPADEGVDDEQDMDWYMYKLRVTALKEKLAEVVNNYDFVFIDCPPFVNKFTKNALVASDGVIIPIRPGEFELRGVSAVMNKVHILNDANQTSVELLMVIMNQFRQDSPKDRGYLKQARETLDEYINKYPIPYSEDVKTSIHYGIPFAFSDGKRDRLKNTFKEYFKAIIEKFDMAKEAN